METLLSSSKIKEIRSLQQKKFRMQSSLFVVEGEKLTEEALRSGFEVLAVYRKDEIGEKAMERISSLSTPSPSLAVVRQRNYSLKDIDFSKGKLYLFLDGVKDPGNMGTIIRLADWFGVSAVMCSTGCVELHNPKTVQATMGAIFRVPVVYCSLHEAVLKAEKCNIPVVGTFLDGEPLTLCGEIIHTLKSCCIVLGNESEGISDELSSMIPAKNHILVPAFDLNGKPKKVRDGSSSESLNVATACAAILSLIRAR